MAANNSNHAWNREEFVQGRAIVLVRVMEDFEGEGGEVWDLLPSQKIPLEAQQHQKEEDQEGYQCLDVHSGGELPFCPQMSSTPS